MAPNGPPPGSRAKPGWALLVPRSNPRNLHFTKVKRQFLTQENVNCPSTSTLAAIRFQDSFFCFIKKSLFSLAKPMFLGSEPPRGRLSLGFEAATKQQPVSSQQQPANSPAAAGQQPAASHSTSSPPPGRQQPANQEQPASSQQPASNQSAIMCMQTHVDR